MGLIRRLPRFRPLGSSPWIGSSHHRSIGRASKPWIILGSALWSGGCATIPDVQSNNLLSGAIAIERGAVACNWSIVSDARYQHLTSLVPLAAPYQASVAQMINTDRANDDEAHALTAWTQDTQKCRRQVIGLVRQSSPISLALVLSAWADEDGVFVGVIQRKLSWGVAATRLRAIQIKLLSNLNRSCNSSRCSAQWCKTGRACATGRYFRCNYQPRAIARQDRKQHRGRKGALPRIGDLAYDNVRSRAQGRLREKILPPFWRTRVISHLVEPSVGQGRGETSYFCRGDVLARNSRTFGLRGRYDRYAADRPGRAASTLVVPRSPAIWPVRAGGSCPSCCAAPVRR